MAELTDQQLKEAYRNALLSGAKEDAAQIQGLIAQRRQAGSEGTMRTVEDVTKGAMGGYGNALLRQIAGAMAAKIGMKPQPVMRKVDELLPVEPQTTAGEYAENVGAGMSFGPGGPVAAAAGGAGGALAKLAEKQGYGPAAQMAAWMAPSLGMSTLKGLRPGAAQKDLRLALEQFQPSERFGMTKNLRVASKQGVELMPWQAAPEGSSVRVLGEAAAEFPGSSQIQGKLARQMGKGDQAWVKERTAPFMEPLAERPVSPEMAERLREAVLGVKASRRLNPEVPDTAAVEKAAGYFGRRVPGDQDAFIAALERAAREAEPGTPAYRAATTRLQQAARGDLEAPPVFKPSVGNVGEVLSGKQAVTSKSTDFASAGQATRGDIRKAIDEVMGSEVPGYTSGLQKYGRVKDIAEIISKDQKLRNTNVLPSPMHEARTGAAPTGVYAGATSTLWAAVPIVRKLAGRAVERRLDKALAARNFKELERIAAEHPQIESVVNFITQGLRSSQTPNTDQLQFAKEYLPGGK